jgi:uroporphyrinogen decarboxylase
LDLGSTGTSTINIRAYHNLREALNLGEADPAFMNFAAQSVKPDDDILERLRVDTRGVTLRGSTDFKNTVRDEGQYDVLYDPWGIGYRKPKAKGHYFDMFHHPLAGRDRKTIEQYKFPQPDDPSQMDGVAGQCRIRKDQGYAVVFNQGFGFGLLHTGTQLLGYEDYFSRMILEPEVIDALTEKVLEGKIRSWEMILKAAGEYIDIVAENDDLGTQRGPFVSMKSYKKHIQPFQRKLFSFIKDTAPHVKILYHSCGSIVDFIPSLIEMGVDAINPVQLSARGMDPAYLKKEFGRDIAFWGGGVDTQATLPLGSHDDIKTEVRRNISIFGRGGGYVFTTVHNIQADVPAENILAMFEALDDLR